MFWNANTELPEDLLMLRFFNKYLQLLCMCALLVSAGCKSEASPPAPTAVQEVEPALDEKGGPMNKENAVDSSGLASAPAPLLPLSPSRPPPPAPSRPHPLCPCPAPPPAPLPRSLPPPSPSHHKGCLHLP